MPHEIPNPCPYCGRSDQDPRPGTVHRIQDPMTHGEPIRVVVLDQSEEAEDRPGWVWVEVLRHQSEEWRALRRGEETPMCRTWIQAGELMPE